MTLPDWRQMTLPGQFILAGAGVMLIAMVVVGNWVAGRIEQTVVQNSAASAALFMESFISPLSQELAETDTLSAPARQALAEIFEGTVLGERIVSYKIWLTDGLIVHASDPDLTGRRFDPSGELQAAAAGRIMATFEDLTDPENAAEAALNIPLLEVYAPIRRAWTGEVIAVAEFYERADLLASDIADARRTSWLVVGGAFLASGVLLFGIVQAGGRTIRQQHDALGLQLAETRRMSRQNADLRRRAVRASSRSTAQTERAVRRIGFDLHDGPAQYLALAALRLDGALAGGATREDAAKVRDSLDRALTELRLISRGLALPDLDGMDLATLVARAVEEHRRQSGLSVGIEQYGGPGFTLDYAEKLCVYRFLQETLSNVARHAHTDRATVTVMQADAALSLAVTDEGAGFDAAAERPVRDDGGAGLFGLRDRAESLGGSVHLRSAVGHGSTITLRLQREAPSP